ncbi:MAG: DPP IV N-terminal domain-containing protein, partial [Acidobacteria bacterium]|nr:DPP IV N-terminal domain-containing protein [Acidobacteriota bacterium]
MSLRMTTPRAAGIAAAAIFVFASLAVSTAPAAGAEMKKADKANYELAARFTPAKVGKLVFDTAVQAHWLETGDRFWYGWETSRGRSFSIVDPLRAAKTPLFDNAKMAALLTRIVLTPYDSQHLPIKTVKFINKDTALRFEFEVQKDSDVRVGDKIVKAGDIEKKREDAKKAKEDAAKQGEKKDEEKKEQDKKDLEKKDQDKKDLDKKDLDKKDVDKDKEPEKKTTTLYFEYQLASGKLTLLPDYEAPPKRPRWASVSPDEKVVVFARGYNLFMMDAENFKLAQKKADDAAIKEVQLTTDGEEHFSYARDLNDEDKKEFQKNEKDRKDYRVQASTIVWSKDSKKFACVRDDERKVGDLWVINILANPRPTLETYRYAMPGEENQAQPELLVFDIAGKAKVK